jgi:hypothetical protein
LNSDLLIVSQTRIFNLSFPSRSILTKMNEKYLVIINKFPTCFVGFMFQTKFGQQTFLFFLFAVRLLKMKWMKLGIGKNNPMKHNVSGLQETRKAWKPNDVSRFVQCGECYL